MRLRKSCTSKFYGVRAQGWVANVKAKSDTYVCIVVVCGVLSRQYDMRRLAAVKMSIKTRSVGGLGISELRINFWGSPGRSRKTCASKFYGVRAQGWVTPVKAKSHTYVCIVVVDGV